jgi:hypothetical protein
MAINAINDAKILITARGSSRWGRKVRATAIGPPTSVVEIIITARKANDSI